MNYILTIVLIAVLFFVSKKIFASTLFVVAQFLGNAIVNKLKLSQIPIINWDYEISNIIIIIAVFTVGPGFAFLVALITMVLHTFHEEVTDLYATVDYGIRSIILVGILWATGEVNVIPWAILVSKIVPFVLDKTLYGSNLWSIYHYKEVFSVFAYFAVFGLF